MSEHAHVFGKAQMIDAERRWLCHVTRLWSDTMQMRCVRMIDREDPAKGATQRGTHNECGWYLCIKESNDED